MEPAVIGLASQARLGSIDATGEGVVAAGVSPRLDISSVDLDRRRAEEAQLSSTALVLHIDDPELSVDL